MATHEGRKGVAASRFVQSYNDLCKLAGLPLDATERLLAVTGDSWAGHEDVLTEATASSQLGQKLFGGASRGQSFQRVAAIVADIGGTEAWGRNYNKEA